MNIEEAVRDTMRELSEETAPPAPDLAGRVLATRRRRRTRTVLAASAAVLALLVAVPVTVDSLGPDGSSAAAGTAEDVIARPDQSPPRNLIAAGRTAVSAYSTTEVVKIDKENSRLQYTWWLYNTTTGKYEKTRWSWLDVAPGMKTAAVIERGLPADRIGLVDLATGKVTRWIELEQGVAGLTWSPDGKKILATTYEKDPGLWTMDNPMSMNGGKPEPGPGETTRTGFTVVDVGSGAARWHRIENPRDEMGHAAANAREDFVFSHDGALAYTNGMSGDPQYYTLDGRKTATPPAEKYVSTALGQAGLSPDGSKVAGGFAGKGKEIAAEVLDPATGERIHKVPGQQLLAWADNDRLIAWGCDPKKCDGKGEFRNQLLLVSVNGSTAQALSDFRSKGADAAGRWDPVFTER